MRCERTWLKHRLQGVKTTLAALERLHATSAIAQSDEPSPPRTALRALQREVYLLRYILWWVPEGDVVATLTQWSTFFEAGSQAREARYQEWYRRWTELPSEEQVRWPEPIRSDPYQHTDRWGRIWGIDAWFLTLLQTLRSDLMVWLQTSAHA